METVEIDGRHFTIKKLSVIQQLHVARRIAPIIASFIDNAPSGTGLNETLASINLTKIAEEIANLSDKNAEYILHTCLNVVTYRDEEAQRDFPVQNQSGNLCYDWIQLPEALRLTGAVIQYNLGGFMHAVPSLMNQQGAA